jgi:L-threonylcarbamoyladenylate synthase
MTDPPFPEEISITKEEISKAAAVIRRGGLVIIPTRGLYGIAADVFNPAAVTRVFALKGRPVDKPLLALINHRDMLTMLVRSILPQAERLMEQFWPGQVTFVLNAAPGLPEGMCSADGNIGVRWVAHPVADALVTTVGRPITGTSANLSGDKGAANIDEIPRQVLNSIDMVLDAGELAGGPGSTVVDVTGEGPLVLRQGAVPAGTITAALKSA